VNPRFILGLLLLAGVGIRAGSSSDSTSQADQTVVLVALDGFHPSYLERPPSRNLRDLARTGVRARWLTPVFPTLTFPNFYSIATGLYPEHHGIVSNTMRDPVLGKFTLNDRAAVGDPRWWGGEPIWVTAIRQGKRAATFFWPGSDVAIGGVRPTYYRVYDPLVPNAERVRQILDWLSLPPPQAPALVTLYLGDVDQAGHEFGPNAPETDSAIARVDSAVGALMSGIEQRGLGGRVNLIVVSDHGMAGLEPSHVIYLGDYLDLGSVEIIDRGPFLSLVPRSGDEEKVYRRLNGANPHLKIYRRSEVPAAYHYRDHPRIPPIIGVVDDGWTVLTRPQRPSPGGHGYPPNRPSMRAIFLARGPAFMKGVVVEPFQNIHIYAMLTRILGLRPASQDGSLDSVKAILARQ
jgi:predicted AlkP superfamily pyrophosphatase or phosphodiesterase